MLWRVGTRGDFGLDLGGGGDEIVFVTRKGKKKDHGRYEKKKNRITRKYSRLIRVVRQL